jgi:hypothetical protein
MRKFVLGILFIACLDVAFIAYSFIARGFGQLQAVQAIPTSGNDPAPDWLSEPAFSRDPVPAVTPKAVRTSLAGPTRSFLSPMDRAERQLQVAASRRRAPTTPTREDVLASYGVSRRSGIRIIKQGSRTLILYPRPAPSPVTRADRTVFVAKLIRPPVYRRN